MADLNPPNVAGRGTWPAALLVLFWLLAGVAAPALGAETTGSEIVIVRPGDVVDDDLYAAAVRVLIEGVVNGDLVAFAAEEVVITGTVNGSVTVVAPTVRVEGTVAESLRSVASDLRVGGEIGGDLVAGGLDLALDPGSQVGGDVLVWVSMLTTSGRIEGDLGGTQRRLRLGGSVGGEVDVSVGRLTIPDSVSVTGDLGYRSARAAAGLEGAEVGGYVVHRTPLPPNIRLRALDVFGRFLVVLFMAMSAMVIAYVWPERVRAAVGRLRESPLRNWLLGASLLFSPLLLLAVAAVVLSLAPPAAGLPLLVVMVPVMLAILGLALVAVVVAAVPAAARLGALVSARLDLFGAVLAGSLLAGIVWLLPTIGWLVPLVLLPWGLGGWLRSGVDRAPVPETTA
jgi:cytoskeletal protein CcmA (bactofilin family)